MGVIAASSRGVSFADSPWINSASSAPFELVIASQVILYRLTALTMHLGWESRSKGSCHMDLGMQISNNMWHRGSRSLMARHYVWKAVLKKRKKNKLFAKAAWLMRLVG